MLVHLFLALLSVAAPNFSGKWVLDLRSSTNLPPYYAHVVSHTLEVTQSDAAIDMVVTVSTGRGKPHRVKQHCKLDRSGRPSIKDQTWELSADGNVLTIRRVEGKIETEMIFLRG
jgi:hypothetical protein